MSGIENPPAFPNTGNATWGLSPTDGMTLRDWFAGQALAITWQQATVMANIGRARDEQVPIIAAGLAFAAADAMLAARRSGDAA